ncbi:DNA-repair protein [Trichinella spiralis]|uniref:DNA-repair protein n=1 Tax=Trichinella spiralis TaxID=6334 RepID=UPI0001EFC99F|nr:DNA-repair protein [Trichinella spiralis]
MQWCLDIRSNIIVNIVKFYHISCCFFDCASTVAKLDGVLQNQNERRFQRKPDKHHHLYSIWPITLCSFVASALHYLTFTKHTCISRSAEYVYANVKENTADGILLRAAVLYKYTLLKSGLISYCVALLGYFGASLQQLRCDC